MGFWLRCFVVLVALGFGFADGIAGEKDQYLVIDKPAILPSFQLRDQYGKDFGVERLQGQWSMIFVGFTTCPDVCPLTLANLEAVRADLGLRLPPDSIPNIVFLAVDPERDRPVLKEYLAYFHPSYIGITGETVEIDKLIKGLDAFYRLVGKKSGVDDYQVIHTSTVSIVNPDAEVVARMNPPFNPNRTGEFLWKLIKGIETSG